MITLNQRTKNWTSLMVLVQMFPEIDDLAIVLARYKADVLDDGTPFDVNGDEETNVPVNAGLFNAPAGSYVHHSYPGGLVEHYLQMISIHETLKAAKIANFEDYKVIETVVLHDLHKGRFNFVYATGEPREGRWFEYAKHPEPSLLGNNTNQTLAMLMNTGYRITSPEVMNALLSSEGGWAKAPPKWCTPLAKYCYILDELSSNVMARQEKGNIWDHRSTKDFNNSWNMKG